MKRLLALFCAALVGLGAATAGRAAETYEMPAAYVPQAQVSGTIRIWGHGAYGARFDFIEGLVKQWEAGFAKFHPQVKFENMLYGTASAIGAIYTGAGDLALMGREIWPNEVSGFTEVKGYPPTGIDVVTGSFNVRNRGYAVVLFVHKTNPIAHLSLKQLDAAFSADRRRGGAPVRTWGDLGLTGEWKDKPVHLYGLPISRGFGQYMEDAVFEGARKWNPGMREFYDKPGSTGGATDGGQMMLDALAQDPYGLAWSGLVYNHPDVKPVALGVNDAGPFAEPTKQNVINHSYPLTRLITMYFDRDPKKPVDPKLREFFRYVLSREAQEAVLRDGGGYLPVVSPFAEQQLKKLE